MSATTIYFQSRIAFLYIPKRRLRWMRFELVRGNVSSSWSRIAGLCMSGAVPDVMWRPIDRFKIISNTFSSRDALKKKHRAILIKPQNENSTSWLLIRAYSENYIRERRPTFTMALRKSIDECSTRTKNSFSHFFYFLFFFPFNRRTYVAEIWHECIYIYTLTHTPCIFLITKAIPPFAVHRETWKFLFLSFFSSSFRDQIRKKVK